ncbi:ABC-type transport auxiliary lipoprotein family protein [Lacisediminimonas sp.]|uniref:ABC-type transport auxiliary lipoprotein family protein n=1 Tax=Lacisediminimonas sp. TaxID=3060582 RepID=UPI0027269341|nr:ABC-type transport auxiliary lipoprotein family protein [Lacisediminimonas sp.]MDO8299380.1 ABC-type transport auxiliary lipoprotein family protein [Lacisediminimonas sp.]MDO9216619.1 ABC-type transport auxiliary lipoprotein family protein [Lacisediminimonas sp.]
MNTARTSTHSHSSQPAQDDHAQSDDKVNMQPKKLHGQFPAAAGATPVQSMLRGLLAAAFALAALGACTSVERRDTQLLYDLGHSAVTMSGAAPAAGAGQAVSALPPLSIGDISAPSWMDSTRMVYRLDYEDPQAAHAYSQSRWTMSPPRLFQQRMKARISAAGGVVLGAGDGGPGVPQLRMEADDFSQAFTAPATSTARVAMRVTVLQDRKLVAQRMFVGETPAATPDAAGGAQALARTSDAIITDMIAWLATLPLKR